MYSLEPINLNYKLNTCRIPLFSRFPGLFRHTDKQIDRIWLEDLRIQHSEVRRWMDLTMEKALAEGLFGSVHRLVLFAALEQVTAKRPKVRIA